MRIAERAVEAHVDLGDERALARARTVLGRLLRRLGRHTDARLQLTAAVEVLRQNPTSTPPSPSSNSLRWRSFAGHPDANRLTDEALALVAALDLPSRFPDVLISRAIYLDNAGRRREAAMFFREAARLAEEQENAVRRGNGEAATWRTSSTPTIRSPPPTQHASAIDLCVRSGDRFVLGTSVSNLVIALAATADWDEAAQGAQRQPQSRTCSPMTSTSSWCARLVQRTARRCRRRRRVARKVEAPCWRARTPRTSPWWRQLERSWRRRATTMKRRCVRVASLSSRSIGPCPSPETTDGGRGRSPPAAPTRSATSPPRRSCSNSASGIRPVISRRCSGPKRC